MNRFTTSNRSRRFAALTLLSFALSGSALLAQDNGTAQGPPPTAQGPEGHGGGRQEHQIEMLTKRLNLTPDQVTQVRALHASTMQQMQALHANTSLSESDKHAQMKAIHEDSQTKLRAMLTDEQKTKFDAMEEHHREHMEHDGGPGAGAPPPPPAQ